MTHVDWSRRNPPCLDFKPANKSCEMSPMPAKIPACMNSDRESLSRSGISDNVTTGDYKSYRSVDSKFSASRWIRDSSVMSRILHSRIASINSETTSMFLPWSNRVEVMTLALDKYTLSILVFCLSLYFSAFCRCCLMYNPKLRHVFRVVLVGVVQIIHNWFTNGMWWLGLSLISHWPTQEPRVVRISSFGMTAVAFRDQVGITRFAAGLSRSWRSQAMRLCLGEGYGSVVWPLWRAEAIDKMTDC